MIGLSKINRIVQFFARRPQVQERLTQQILLALQTLLGTRDVAISIKATHFCVKARGVMGLHLPPPPPPWAASSRPSPTPAPNSSVV